MWLAPTELGLILTDDAAVLLDSGEIVNVSTEVESFRRLAGLVSTMWSVIVLLEILWIRILFYLKLFRKFLDTKVLEKLVIEN